MLVGGQRLGDAPVVHHDKGHAIGQPLLLVRPRRVDLNCSGEQSRRDWYDLDLRAGFGAHEQGDGSRPPAVAGERIPHFRQHGLCGHEWTREAPGEGSSTLVIAVALINQRDPIAGVQETGGIIHRLGVP